MIFAAFKPDEFTRRYRASISVYPKRQLETICCFIKSNIKLNDGDITLY